VPALGGTRERRPKAEHAGRTSPSPRGGINNSSCWRGSTFDFDAALTFGTVRVAPHRGAL